MSSSTYNQTGAGQDGTFIKKGNGGRRRYDEAFRLRVLEDYAASGLAAAAFARQHGLKYPTFIAWLRKAEGVCQNGTSRGRCVQPRFLVGDHEPGSPGSRALLEVELAGGMVARARDHAGVELLAQLLGTLCRRGGGTC